MLESLGKSISTIVDERLSSPLVSSFVIAWCLYNYKFLVILFSSASVSDTFRLIHEVSFPNYWIVFRDGFGVPLVATAIYIFLLPFPAKYVFEKWRRTQKEINAIKNRIDGDALLSLEDSRAMRAKERELFGKLDETANEVNKLRDDLRTADQTINQLNLAAKSAEARATEATERAQRIQNLNNVFSISKQDAINEGPSPSHPDFQEESNPDGDAPDVNEPSNSLTHLRHDAPTSNFRLPITKNGQELSEGEKNLLLIVAKSKSTTDEEIVRNSTQSSVANQYYLDLLIAKKLLILVQKSEHDDTKFVQLTHAGREYLVENRLV